MKKIFLYTFLLVSISTYAQQKVTSYEAEWKKIDKLINEQGLPESALKEVNRIYSRAVSEKNEAQKIKALIYRASLRQREEEAEVNTITEFENEAGKSTGAAKSILLNLAAEGYNQYFQQNRWKIADRTAVQQDTSSNFETWSPAYFNQKISSLFLASLANESLLQATKLSLYDPIINKGNARALRPTLFDLLTHRALDYFQHQSVSIKPLGDFQISDSLAFSDAATFSKLHIKTSDSLSPKYISLRLYQRLLGFHHKEKNTSALVDADLLRLQFVYQNTSSEHRRRWYQQALERLIHTYPSALEPSVQLAQLFVEDAGRYNPPADTSGQSAYTRARSLLEVALRNADTSLSRVNALYLLREINHKTIALTTELVNSPGTPFRALVNYRNVPELFGRIVRLDRNMKESLGENTWDDSYWTKLLAFNSYRTFQQKLPSAEDHHLHRAEMKVDSLPVGRYAIITSTDRSFSRQAGPISVNFIHVSDIAYVSQANQYYVVHRQSGHPLKNASVQQWEKLYNRSAGRYLLQKLNTYQTDARGMFKLAASKTKSYRQLFLEINAGNDYLFVDEIAEQYSPSINSDDINVAKGEEDFVKNNARAFIFTDRSIYRPGQTVTFKTILTSKDYNTKIPLALANRKSKMYLLDVNGERVDSLEATTNAFGSYSGKFQISAGRLTGAYQLQDGFSGHIASISVEEYKRPTFIAQLNPVKQQYRLNDSVTVTGSAKSYAGSNTSNATVVYRVTRRTVVPYWPMTKIWPPYPRELTEITNGTVKADASGNFNITFKAIADEKYNRQQQPIFYYEVTADVTDLAGETRSGQLTIPLGYQALQLSVDMPERIPVDSLQSLRLTTTNLTGEFIKSFVAVKVVKLQEPARIFRERLWAMPDQLLMTMEEYYKSFPNDIFLDENLPQRWKEGATVHQSSDSSRATSGFPLSSRQISPGYYKIEASTTDQFGERVTAVDYVQLIGDAAANGEAFASIIPSTTSTQPGATLKVAIHSNLRDIRALYQVQAGDSLHGPVHINLNTSPSNHSITIKEADRGGVTVNVVFVKMNRVFTATQHIDVPFSNKKLEVVYQTYRDKTLPGSQEKWKIQIKGPGGEKLATEVLSAMYDASLDQFQPHNWQVPAIWVRNNSNPAWAGYNNFTISNPNTKYPNLPEIKGKSKIYDQLMYESWNRPRMLSGRVSGVAVQDAAAAPTAKRANDMSENGEESKLETQAFDTAAVSQSPARTASPEVQVRKNFNETAFMFPELRTDSAGNVELNFTIPEAITTWKWLTLAHTQDLAFGLSEKSIITQKELMVRPNAPRFLREGDRIDFSGTISNLSQKELTGQVELQLIDPVTNQSVDGWFRNMFPNQYFTAAAGESVPVSFTIEVPFDYAKPVTYRLIAKADSLSDGEEAYLPVISNRILITESVPLPVRGSSAKQFKFEKLLKSGDSETLTHHNLTVEFTSNPAWYAVQSLPFLKESNCECVDQVFNRLYANALAVKIAADMPALQTMIDKWRSDSVGFISNLHKNEELKTVLLQETPWVMQGKTEEEQKKNLAILFNIGLMKPELQNALTKLSEMQLESGGFAWMKGAPEDRYMTQYVISGIGHLVKLGAIPKWGTNQTTAITRNAIRYLDRKLAEDYKRALSVKPNAAPGLSSLEIQYMYMRSFFTNISVPGETFSAYNHYRKLSQSGWVKQSRYMQGMIALALYRTGDVQTAKNIIASLKQNAIKDPEMGMYWKENTGGYLWHQAPIETHSLLTEAFSEINADQRVVDELRTWLLKNKQTNGWKTSKATADATYALLLRGSNWLTSTPAVQVKLGDLTLPRTQTSVEQESGYFKEVIPPLEIKPDMGNIQVFVKSKDTATAQRPAWGAVYWQYFENLENVSFAKTPVQLNKQLFLKKNTATGPSLVAVRDGEIIKVGDRITVRLELKVDREMEYMHLKDMRASSLEPVNVLSGYRWKGGMGYYESTRDASTSFFFENLRRGTYVFEYDLFVTHSGTFNNGVASIESMYAPEYRSHSGSLRLNIEQQ